MYKSPKRELSPGDILGGFLIPANSAEYIFTHNLLHHLSDDNSSLMPCDWINRLVSHIGECLSMHEVLLILGVSDIAGTWKVFTNSPGYPYGFISPACPMTIAEKTDVLGDAETILKSGQYYGLCVVLTEALQCWPKFCYHRGIKPLLPNVPALLSYHFPEFNKGRFAPSGISYDGYWWDKYDTDTRMQVLCELTDIYKEKLVGRSGPGEDKLSE